jgi:transposase
METWAGTLTGGAEETLGGKNKHLRKSMHLPALSAIRNNERFKAIFVRLVAKHGIKMKAATAVQRKLLE